MKTLRKLTRRKSKLQIVGYLLFFGTLGVFLFTIGVKLLISSVFFIVDLTSGRQSMSQSTSQDQELFIAPQIIDIPDATNSARIRISGTAPEDMPVTLFVNGDKQKTIVATDGTFEAALSLNDGENDIYAQAENEKTKEKKNSKIYYVRVITDKPELTITSPADGSIIGNSDVRIEGTTGEEVLVKINGLPVVVDSEGTFSYSISLVEGSNTIVIMAIDIAGNTEQKTLTITYEKI